MLLQMIRRLLGEQLAWVAFAVLVLLVALQLPPLSAFVYEITRTVADDGCDPSIGWPMQPDPDCAPGSGL